MLALAAVIRMILAAHGWPYANSDEATIGLMVDDILRDAAHPAFTYGEHHVGALDAYLQAPAFLALGHTNLALHVTTTIQYLLFLLVLYAFTRAVFSPRVAVGALLLLAVGGELALLFSMRAGHHEQDTLLLGTLLLWLTFLRLRERGGSRPAPRPRPGRRARPHRRSCFVEYHPARAVRGRIGARPRRHRLSPPYRRSPPCPAPAARCHKWIDRVRRRCSSSPSRHAALC